MNQYNRKNQTGFTLVELSIVLIIIGLLTVGVLVGQSIIRSARIRATIGDITNYQSAFNLFVTKYGSMPGDIADITDSLAGGTLANGNGDGQVVWTCSGAVATCSEGAQAFYHLFLAGMIPGSFTGTVNGTADAALDINIPSSKFTGTGYSFDYNAATGNHLHFGAVSPGAGINDGFAISPVDANNIDTKMDDGLPASGRVQDAHAPAAGACSLAGAPNTYDLPIGSTTQLCTIDFQMDSNQ